MKATTRFRHVFLHSNAGRVALAAIPFLALVPSTAKAEVPQPLTVSDASVGRTIATGAEHACALAPSGIVYCWGRNDQGQLGLGFTSSQESVPVSLGLTDVVSVVAGGQHTCALRSDGTVWCWGANPKGQLGDANLSPKTTPSLVAGLSNIRQVTAGKRTTCALTTGGAAYCWGANDLGQLGAGLQSAYEPAPQLVGTGFRGVYSGSSANHSCAIDGSGWVYCWGDNSAGQLGNGFTGGFEDSPEFIPVFEDFLNLEQPVAVTTIAVGAETTLAFSAEGSVPYIWGFGPYTYNTRPYPWYEERGAVAISVGNEPACTVSSYGRAFCYGRVDGHLPPPNALQNATTLSEGAEFGCAVTAVGDVYCWGNNDYGQLGTGCVGDGCQAAPPTIPVAFGGVAIASNSTPDVSTSDYHSCFKAADGAVKCSGYNASGQLGNGTTVSSTSPVDVVGLPAGSTAQVVAGTYHSCALKVDGTVWCWGRNNYGQIGVGTLGGYYTTPQQVPVSDAVQLSLGKYHACARTAHADVYCWGLNEGGQSGAANLAPQPSPVLVDGDYRNVGVGQFHSCAVDYYGNLKCWGRGSSIGLGTNQAATPITVPLPAGTSDVRASWQNTCAIMGNGALYCWGRNVESQLLTSNPAPESPVQIGLIGNVSQVAVGAQSICAQPAWSTKPYCWGANNELQLGQNITDRTLVTGNPGLVSNPTYSRSLSGHGKSFCSFGTDGDTRCWGDNGEGQLGIGSTADQAAPTPMLP